ncbi:RNA polymerase sigma factor [Negadavirga shengliensis]|uniref:RNA polymerase sigma factor n=1 Tax=Negadavirga shengliensis TaxID=1389218 RepID=A0ABV9T1A7_9BACT
MDKTFISLVNKNLGIAHKVSQIYFNDQDSRLDAIQEMMYQLWKSYPSFDQRSRFSTWMYSVCLNTALTYLKKNKGNKNETLNESHHHIPNEHTADQEEQSAQLRRAISLLSSLNKAIILLYLEGHSYDEISEITGLTKSNVSVRLVRIKKELEKRLKKTFSH